MRSKYYHNKSIDRHISISETKRVINLRFDEGMEVTAIAEYINLKRWVIERVVNKQVKPRCLQGVSFGSRTQPYYETEEEMEAGLPDYGTIDIRYKSTEMRKDWKLY